MTAPQVFSIYSTGSASAPVSRVLTLAEAQRLAAQRVRYPGDHAQVYSGASQSPVYRVRVLRCFECDALLVEAGTSAYGNGGAGNDGRPAPADYTVTGAPICATCAKPAR